MSEDLSDIEEVREILSCPGVRALLQAHDVVAHEVYGEEAVRVTPPTSTVNLTVGDDVEGPNGECPQVKLQHKSRTKSSIQINEIIKILCTFRTDTVKYPCHHGAFISNVDQAIYGLSIFLLHIYSFLFG